MPHLLLFKLHDNFFLEFNKDIPKINNRKGSI